MTTRNYTTGSGGAGGISRPCCQRRTFSSSESAAWSLQYQPVQWNSTARCAGLFCLSAPTQNNHPLTFEQFCESLPEPFCVLCHSTATRTSAACCASTLSTAPLRCSTPDVAKNPFVRSTPT